MALLVCMHLHVFNLLFSASFFFLLTAVRYQYLTIAADLVLENVNEPVRFKRWVCCETIKTFRLFYILFPTSPPPSLSLREVKVRVSKGDLLGSLLTSSWTKRKVSAETYLLILKKVGYMAHTHPDQYHNHSELQLMAPSVL